MARNLKPFGQTLYEGGLAAAEVAAEPNDQRMIDPLANRFPQLMSFIRSMGRYLELSADHGAKSF